MRKVRGRKVERYPLIPGEPRVRENLASTSAGVRGVLENSLWSVETGRLVNILLATCTGPVTSPLEPGFFLWKMRLVIIHIHLRVDGNMTWSSRAQPWGGEGWLKKPLWVLIHIPLLLHCYLTSLSHSFFLYNTVIKMAPSPQSCCENNSMRSCMHRA